MRRVVVDEPWLSCWELVRGNKISQWSMKTVNESIAWWYVT